MPLMMKRGTSGIVCAVAGAMLFAVACSFGGSSDSKTSSPDAGTSGTRCGDGVCAATEINSCPADCGTSTGSGSNTGSGSGSATGAVCGNGVCEATESTTSCPSDCPGGGSGTLDCSDPTVLFACITCLGDATMCVGVDQASCTTCLGI